MTTKKKKIKSTDIKVFEVLPGAEYTKIYYDDIKELKKIVDINAGGTKITDSKGCLYIFIEGFVHILMENKE